MIVCAKPGSNSKRANGPAAESVSRWPFTAPAAGPANIRLRDLCAGVDVAAVRGDLGLVVRDLATDCRRRLEGALYFALPDRTTGEPVGVEQAIARGAAAVVADRPVWAPAGVAVVQTRDVRAAMAGMAKTFYGRSVPSLVLAGVAGAHGKTTVCHLLHQLLNGTEKTALFGSIRHDLGGRVVPSYQTTPDPVDFYGMLEQAGERGCRRAVVELSSEGLGAGGLAGVGFGSLIYVNGPSTPSVPEIQAFLRMAEQGPATVAVNLDDPTGRRLIQMLPETVKVVRFGESPHADIRGSDVRCSAGETTLRIEWPEGSARIRLPLTGRFQVTNLLAAAAGAWAAGADLGRALPLMAGFQTIPGRMAPVGSGRPFPVLVDAANTGERLRHALRAARELTTGELLVVFGCAGGTTRDQRRGMVEAVQDYAGFAWATLDDPGFEAPERIFSDIRAAVGDPERLVLLEDRRRAIALALDTARPGDLVMIMGKGHAAFQHVRGAMFPFNDAAVAAELLAAAEGVAICADAGFPTRKAC